MGKYEINKKRRKKKEMIKINIRMMVWMEVIERREFNHLVRGGHGVRVGS